MLIINKCFCNAAFATINSFMMNLEPAAFDSPMTLQ